MVAHRLAAVEPERLVVCDGDGEDLRVLALGRGEKAGEDGILVDRLAGPVEGGLHEGVVLGQEVHLHQVAGLGHHVLGLEEQLGGEAGLDAVDDAGGGRRVGGGAGQAEQGRGSEGGGGEGNHDGGYGGLSK